MNGYNAVIGAFSGGLKLTVSDTHAVTALREIGEVRGRLGILLVCVGYPRSFTNPPHAAERPASGVVLCSANALELKRYPCVLYSHVPCGAALRTRQPERHRI